MLITLKLGVLPKSRTLSKMMPQKISCSLRRLFLEPLCMAASKINIKTLLFHCLHRIIRISDAWKFMFFLGRLAAAPLTIPSKLYLCFTDI